MLTKVIQYKSNTITSYLIAFAIGVIIGFRAFPEFVGFLYVVLAVVCIYLAFQSNTGLLFSIIPYLIYTEMFIRVFAHTVPYLFMQYFLLAIFTILILRNQSRVKMHSRGFI